MDIVKNEGYRKLKSYLKLHFTKINRYMVDCLIKNFEDIHSNEVIDTNIFGDSVELFLKNNNRRTEEVVIDKKKKIIIKKDYYEAIIKHLLKYKRMLISSKTIDEVQIEDEGVEKDQEESNYVDIVPKSNEVGYYGDNIYLIEKDVSFKIPNVNTTWRSVLHNLFHDKEFKYGFNRDILEVDNLIEGDSYIRTMKFRIKSKVDNVLFPTRYRWICTHPTEYGECGNIVDFCKLHFHSQIKCNMNKPENSKEKGHIIKNPENVIPFEQTQLYGYIVYPFNNPEKEMMLYSLTEIRKDFFKSNFVLAKDKNDFVFSVAHTYIEPNKKPLNIIQKRDGEEFFFVFDLFKDIQDYYDEYHNIEFSDNNKIISIYIIIMNICKLFFDDMFNGLFIGDSGSGKTFLAKMITPLFTIKKIETFGASISKNRFLGGRSNVASVFYNSMYESGYIESMDCVIIDEITDIIDNIYSSAENGKPLAEHLFMWLKVAQQKDMNRGIQGSRNINPNAFCLMFGNTEPLVNISNDYIKKVRSNYTRSTSGKVLSYTKTKYRPIEFYNEFNTELARSHAYTRDDYTNKNYITGLDEPNMGRVTFFVCLENGTTGFKDKIMSGDVDFKFSIHRDEFLEELHQKIDKKLIDEVPKEFKKDVFLYLNKYFKENRNNLMFNSDRDVNTHLFNNLFKMFSDILILNKIWYGRKFVFNRNDELIIDAIMVYNYNVLDYQEARMIKRPKINDMFFDTKNLREQVAKEKIDYKNSVNNHSDDIHIKVDTNNIPNEEDKNDIFDNIDEVVENDSDDEDDEDMSEWLKENMRERSKKQNIPNAEDLFDDEDEEDEQ